MKRFPPLLWSLLAATSLVSIIISSLATIPKFNVWLELETALPCDTGDASDWMNDLTRSLVTVQLAAKKTEHFERFIQPSWKRLQFEPNSSIVVADLFVACHPDACKVVDKETCHELPKNFTRETFARRAENEILCLYAAVPEKEDETYAFAHSLNFLQMEPFQSILDLGFYDYFLRTDADAILFPGLLTMPPTGDGWVGSGFHGMELTDHLIRHSVQKFLPDLAGFRHLNGTTPFPNTQSTFYVHKSKFEQFVSVLLRATKTLYEKAFTQEACAEIQELPISKELHPEEKNLCRWAYWHRQVSSLYGTRVAIDHVLGTVTVTEALDATATNMRRAHGKGVHETIQAHLLGIKNEFVNIGKNATGLCAHPIDTIRALKSSIGDRQPVLFDAMEDVYRDSSKSTQSVAHYIASIMFEYYHREQCQKEDLK